MLQVGKQITQVNDTLQTVSLNYLYNAIKSPKQEISSQIRQLRAVAEIDKVRYRELKKKLPYIVCGRFSPPYRKSENFAWIKCFIIDIDHIQEKQINIIDLKQKLSKDERVVMIFASPSNDGLKVVFELKDKCYDLKKFSIFYKTFAQELSNRYSIDQVIDTRTSDATRACFISEDSDIYFNSDAELVSMDQYVNFENVEEVDQIEFNFRDDKNNTLDIPTKDENKQLSDDVLLKIKQKLNPNIRLKAEKKIYVPEEINSIIETVTEKLKLLEIQTIDIRSINYGKKFILKAENMKAEINVFYGKRGFSVVESPKKGTNEEFNKIASRAISEILY